MAEVRPEVQARRAQIDQCLRSFREDRHAQDTAWHSIHAVPRRLYHYTTLAGLVGIAETSKIWASDARFMNDASELTYASRLVDEAMSAVLRGELDDVLKPLLTSRPGFANGFEFGAHPFLACFCEADDLLSQWRAYGQGTAPAALGFDFSFILATGGHHAPLAHLRKVIYDEKEQRRLVEEATRTWLATVKRLMRAENVAPKDLFPYPAIWALQEALAEHHLCFKHPAFSEEREWRLIKLVNVREELALLEDRRRESMMAAVRQRAQEMGVDFPHAEDARITRAAEGIDIKFRPSSRGLVPYVELPVVDTAGVFTGRLPLWEVTQGPTAHPELALESLTMFLERAGYGFHTKTRASDIPLRP